jgi:hypothetical protein
MVLVEGREILLAPQPVEYPVLPSWMCWNKPQLRPICQRCEGRGVVGENTPWNGIAVNERGEARRWSRHNSQRQWGEALYRLHRCR